MLAGMQIESSLGENTWPTVSTMMRLGTGQKSAVEGASHIACLLLETTSSLLGLRSAVPLMPGCANTRAAEVSAEGEHEYALPIVAYVK